MRRASAFARCERVVPDGARSGSGAGVAMRSAAAEDEQLRHRGEARRRFEARGTVFDEPVAGRDQPCRGSLLDSAPMPRIHRLASAVIDRIAAGEVVERPASAVKELVENALDAGASRDRRRGGRRGIDRILVRDDGSGMSAEDARLALERHATSKISTDARPARRRDLRLPGRGAALDRVGLEADADDLGRLIAREAVRLHGSTTAASPSEEPAARPRGTDVLVEGLFAKTPARRKFLASPGGGGARRRGRRDEGRARRIPPSPSRCARTAGRRWTRRPRSTAARGSSRSSAARLSASSRRSRRGRGRCALAGYATRGSVTFPTRRYQYLFVNGRPVEDRALSRAIGQASRDAIRLDRHPARLPLPDGRARRRRRQRLAGEDAGPLRRLRDRVPPRLPRAELGPRSRARRSGACGRSSGDARRRAAAPYRDPSPCRRSAPVGVPPPPPATPARRRGPEPPAEKKAPDILPIGQHRESFILASRAGGPARHRPARRARAHALRAHPRPDRLGPRCSRRGSCCASSSRRRPEEVETLGRALRRPRGGGLRDRADVRPLLRDRGAARRGDRPRSRARRCAWRSPRSPTRAAPTRPLRRDRLAASIACRSAVTIRYHLAPEEIRHLSSDWSKTRDRFTCPHGRPVVLSMSEEELEKYFKRR